MNAREVFKFDKGYPGMSDALDFVCRDVNKNSVWKYDEKNKKYVRFSKSGEILSFINGASLPDPEKLWDMRIRRLPQAHPDELKPQDATFALYEHWRARA